mgnify:FL=1
MNINDILSKVDHTLLKQTATWEDIRKICDDGMKFKVASICIPPSYVKKAKEYIKSKESNLKVCTVIGFPNGYNTSEVKCFETKNAIENGADEIDMVINLGWVKENKYDLILQEIMKIKQICNDKVLKVIIETCFWTDEEKIKLCEVVSDSGVDYIKTSTGFGSKGATAEDIIIFNENISKNLKIKAAGGISSIEDAEKYIELGASRLGTSKIVSIAEKIKS